MRSVRALPVAALIAITLGCGFIACGGSGESAMPSSNKSAMRGLLDLGDISFYTNSSPVPTNDPSELQPFAKSFRGIVINATWTQLQSDGPGALAANNGIDQGLQAVRGYNFRNPSHPLTVKLRVWGGLVAPTWAKQLGGGPIPVTFSKPSGTGTGTVGPWWSDEYIQAWRDLQALLAHAYDGNPLIREVAVTSCASNTDEPFVSWSDVPETIQTLQSFGYSDTAQQKCLAGAIDDYAAWTHTPIDYPFSIFQATDNDVPPTPKLCVEPNFTASVMQACIANGHCILSNQALRQPEYAPDGIVYQTMAAAFPGATIDFQTASPMRIYDWCGTIADAVALHASSVEMWGDFGGFLTMPDGPAIMANLSHAVLSQTSPASSPCPPLPSSTPTPVEPGNGCDSD